MKRRDFLKFMLAAGGSSLLLGSSSAQAAPAPKTVIVIFQRGGCDGLNVVVPHGEDEYYNLRPTIAIPRPNTTGGALDIDGFFGLNPTMTGLYDLYQNGHVAIFPAAHYPNASRSHFDGQQYIESAQRDRNVDGWLNRHLASSANSSGMRGVSFGNEIAQALRGNVPVSAFRDLNRFNLGMESSAEQALVSRLNAIYGQNFDTSRPYRAVLRDSGRTLFTDLDVINQIDTANYQPENGASYPNNGYGTQLRQTAQLIKEGVGLEVATVSIGGWDTHNNQGSFDGGQAQRLGNFSDGIAALYADLGSRMQDVVILTMTEFGRTAQENGSNGTDHGHASAWFAIGGSVNGNIYGTWPGLQEAQLERGRYLAQATDYRDILGEILTQHLGNSSAGVVPGHQYSPLGFIS